MKQFILGLIIGLLLGTAVTVVAQSRSVEFIFNDAWTDATNTLKIIGQ